MNNQKLPLNTEITLTGWKDERKAKKIISVFQQQGYTFPITAKVTGDTGSEGDTILQLPKQGTERFTKWNIFWFNWTKN